MKIIFIAFVLLSIAYGLNGNCVRHQPGEQCQQRVFPEPEPRDIHYIYHGETCECPKYHSVVVEKPVETERHHKPTSYEYNIQVPADKKSEKTQRYLFDVRFEKPVEIAPESNFGSYNYAIQAPTKAQGQAQSPVRYIFDGRVEKPVEPCKEKPWQGLVAQVDRVMMPSKGCQNSDHTPESCDCGCRNPGHTPETCTCGSNDYKLPIIYNSRYDTHSGDPQNAQLFTFPDSMTLPSAYGTLPRKAKRETSPEKKPKSNRREMKLPKLKSLRKTSPKAFKPIQEVDLVAKPSKISRKTSYGKKQLRSKRKPDSPCGYTYESCDPKKHNRDGCPLCYKCKCEPINKQTESQKFSPYDIKIPYKMVSNDDAPRPAAANQEFDFEQPSYTGLKEQDMYKKYIKQIVTKYPEHMSRKMPDLQEQQQDLMKFIGELSKSNKSPGKQVDTEDVRYKMMDNAMDMYKYYEKAMSVVPKNPLGQTDGKYFKKRGTVLEVIELDPEDYDGGSYRIAGDPFEENVSESQ